MIYREGSVRVTGGSHVITGIGTRFLSEAVPVGAVLIIGGFVGCSQVAKVIGDFELHLAVPPRGLTPGIVLTTSDYSISSDFTPTFMMPYPNKGETDNAHLLMRALETLDKVVPQVTQ